MNDESKKKLAERYQRELDRGEHFWPDSLYKDVLVSLGFFLLLVLLATFIGVPVEPKADPSDTTYIPRPEWYFLFLFKFLALYGQIPVIGQIEWIATMVIPGAIILALTLTPFIDRSPNRYYSKRVLPLSLIALMVVQTITLTLIGDTPTVSEDGSHTIGVLQTVGNLVIPLVGLILLFLLAYAFKVRRAKPMVWTTGVTALLMVGFTVGALGLAPPPAAEATEVATALTDQIAAGQDLYSIDCVECHGEDGKVTTITGVEGLEGKQISAIDGHDVLYTLDDPSLAEVIAYGRPDAGMTPFGKAYNPEGLTKTEIDYIVTFMRYTWDDRFEAPPIKPLFPALAEGEVPSYDVHIQPIVKRYCISCHRSGKTNNNYLMTTYEEILTTGDNKDKDVIAGDPNSYLLQVIQGHEITDPNDPSKVLIRTMPPNSTLKPDVVDVFLRWVEAGMPETADEAAALSVTTTTGAASTTESTTTATSTP
jgi:mono/diheme cytochrome c family protein